MSRYTRYSDCPEHPASENETHIEALDLKHLPENILPETHGLLVFDEGSHGHALREDRRFFLIRRGTITVVHQWDQPEEIEIGNDPTLMYHDVDDDGYQFVLPEGSVELVDDAWVACASEAPEGMNPRPPYRPRKSKV